MIKLKQYNEIDDIYDFQLEKLIMQNHRFVIIHHYGINKQTLAICLLSTSSYLNEKMELGVKLSGSYNEFKDVYMDATRCWIIPANYTKSIEYKLNLEDKFRCISNWSNNYSGKMKVIKGVCDNCLVNTQLNNYISHFNTTDIDNELGMVTIAIYLKRYIEQLSDEEVMDYLEKTPKEEVRRGMIEVARYTELHSNSELGMEFLRGVTAFLMIKNGEYVDISKKLARGY